MLSFKRKRDEFEDSDDEEPAFGKQILPVANLPEDFNDEPTDGMQYLFTVRYAVVFSLKAHDAHPMLQTRRPISSTCNPSPKSI